jgi:ribosome-binding ATPase YchF (GTP1/OBG family)
LNTLSEDERKEYLTISGIQEGGLDQVIRTGYETLNLISFFTYNENEARAWTVEKGAKAPDAAGQIHTDFQEGFIKAEVIPFQVFEDYGSTSAAKEAGKLQIEGKDYIVKDGDVIFFRFNK